MTPLRVHAGDPSVVLEAAFARIELERMAGVPILNAALRVQAVDFARWQGQWLGALVTPWFLNLVLVPGRADSWRSVADGARVFHRFGAGAFAFLGGAEPEVGEFQCCSLVSPMGEFATQQAACATARAALRMLHVEQPVAELVGAAGAAGVCTAVSSGPAAAPATRGCRGARSSSAAADHRARRRRPRFRSRRADRLACRHGFADRRLGARAGRRRRARRAQARGAARRSAGVGAARHRDGAARRAPARA